LRIDYEITEQDFLDAQKLAIKKSGPAARMARWYMPILGCGMLLFLALNVRHLTADPRLFIGAAFALYFIAIPWLTRRKQKKMYESTQGMHGRLSAEFDDTGVRFSGPNHNGFLGWQNYASFSEDPCCFLLWQPTKIFNIIPKRHLASQQVEELRSFLSTHLTQK
jgi:hypothetical protein